MRFSDETLMAFADGELDEPTRSAVEQAMRSDPAIAAKVAQHKALRADIFGAFAPALDERVPPRLKQVINPANSAKVVNLDTVRASRREAAEPRRWAWAEWGAIAATLVIGVLAGSLGLKGIRGETQLAAVSGKDGALTARGKLDAALSQQLASAAPDGGGVKIGLSFVSKEGNYCRSFTLGAAAGLACRSGTDWKIPVMAQGTAPAPGEYRQAGSAMPAAVLDAIDQRIAGQALDAKAERAAAQQGWKR
jgi:hypothetical protein